MARIRHLEIQNFRSIRRLEWIPSNGINCLVGPGDSGKSSILDAIDLCLGARRAVAIADSDFFELDVSREIVISATVGDLPDSFLSMDVYGEFLRAFDTLGGRVEDEPRAGVETVLTVRFAVASDLEPTWGLFSNRADQQGLERSLLWKHRGEIAPIRSGNASNANLSWTRTSVLNRLTGAVPDLAAGLAGAARETRMRFGDQANGPLVATLNLVNRTATSVGVDIGRSASALLDAHAISVGSGAIALHNEQGVPLRLLGTGSARLLVAGLERCAAQAASMMLIDEVEAGLEPHRLAMLLDTLGAKEADPPLQVFMTSHSPVAVRELNCSELQIVRVQRDCHVLLSAALGTDVQRTLRKDPEAFFAKSILVCEGASEVGLARGLDQFWTEGRGRSFFSLGGAYVNVGGGTPHATLSSSLALCRLGYRVRALLDGDVPAAADQIAELQALGGGVSQWRPGMAFEDELFLHLPDAAVTKLLTSACDIHTRELIASHIMTKSENTATLDSVEAELQANAISSDSRRLLGVASRVRRHGWFKSVTAGQHIGRHVVGPHLAHAEAEFQTVVKELMAWMHAA